MKIGVAIAPANALPSAFVVWRGLSESIKKAAALGYDGVELALASKDQVNTDEIKSLCETYEVEVSAISTGQVFAASGLYLTHPNRDRCRQAIVVLQGLIDVAAEFGQKLNIGRVRGLIPEGETYDDALQRFVAAMREVADYAYKQDVEVLLEPVNRYEINFINSLSEAAEALKEIDRPNVRLMPDVFHMNIEDVSIWGELVRYRSVTSYIHFADSNRLAPGQGHLHFPELINTLKAMDYHGWITVEILPKPSPDVAAAQAIRYLRQFIP